MNVFAMFGLGVAAILGLGLASSAADTGMRIHAMLFAGAAVLAVFALISRIYGARAVAATAPGAVDYNDGVIRAGVIASVFWGLAVFVVGLVLALQLAFPVLNFDTSWINFGRLRPLHTSAVIFAFGGNVLIMTSFYCVQRTCLARLAG